MSFKKTLFAFGFAATAASHVFAGYTISRTDGGNNTLLVQGREYTYLISNTDNPRRLEDVTIDINNPNFDIFVSPGIQTGSNKYSVDSSGNLIISIRFNGATSFSMTVKNSQDLSNFGTLNGIQVQKYPTTFSITPNNPTVTSNIPFNLNITALDSTGVTVTAFEDPVQIVDSQMGTVTFVPGTSFVNGQATNVSVTVKAADLNNQFTLTFTMVGQQYYDPGLPAPSLAPRATKVTNPALTLIPGPFAKLVMLFPGEVLTPGSGKSGTVTAVQSGTPVSLVTIRRVDAFFNPILVNPNPAVNVDFTSSQAGVDNPPFPFSRTMTGSLMSITAAMNQIFFGGSGDRIVKAIPDGNSSQEDSSLVHVNPGAADTYQITLVGVPVGSNITTDQIIQARIQAYDQNGMPLTTFFGTVPGAELRAVLGSGQESISWVDTDSITLVPENVVNFSAGLAVVNLQVTKFGSGVKLRFVTPNSPAAESTVFNVDVGAPNKIHFTIVGKAPNPTQGEIWTPGTYPGNSGVPPVVKVGEYLVVEARITDRHWNLISGGGSAYNMQLVNNLPDHYIESNNPNPSFPGPIYTFPNNGDMSYNSNPAFDKSFRVMFRTAGPTVLVSAPLIKSASNLLGGTFFSSTMTVNAEAYSKMVLAVPGETLRPGTDSEADGKSGLPSTQQAGVQFNGTAYATDLYFNPVSAGPFPTVDFNITPTLPTSFVAGALPSAMQSSTKVFQITLSSGSNVRLLDSGTPAINQTVSIPVGFGPIHHFKMVLGSAGAKEAGVPFAVTITAEDQYGNPVTTFNQTINLLANTGAATMSPGTLAITNGVFNGNLTMFAASPSAQIQMSFNSVISQSPTFVVNVNSLGYRKLLLLMPGETAFPGTANGKTGTASPVTAGVVSVVKAISCDNYYNPLMTTSVVQFSSDKYAQFGSAQGTLANVDGHGEYSTTMILRTAGVHTITLVDVNQGGTISSSNGLITANVGSYRKLQILAPGEVSDPGTFVPNGKTAAAPANQKAGVPFNVTINAVDDFWNVVASFNAGDINLAANTPFVLFNPPNNAGATPRLFTNGVGTRQVILGQQGIFQITATDSANLTKPGQTVELTFDPGPVYVINVAPTATAGQPFSATISLEEGGVPLAGYNGTVYLTASLAAGGTASGQFNPDGTPRAYNMTNGVVAINDLVYGHVERIKIRVADNFNRVAFSNDIEINPSGLKYKVIVPGSAFAGPPSTFDVTVQLLEENTNTLVKNHDHEIAVRVISAVNPTTDGQFTVVSANLAQGVVTFQQSYTKAESIIIEISESSTAGEPNFTIVPKNSNNINVKADGYKKLLILAPGETHVPGVPSATGKTGTPFTRQVGVAFLVQVRGVDQYWNVDNEFSGGQIFYNSNDIPASLNATNPSNQNAPLANGETASNVTLFSAGDIDVTVRDNANPSVSVQTVKITVGGNIYELTVPAQDFAGPPTTFSMSITLKDSITGNVVTGANHAVLLFPFHPDGTPAAGNLGVTELNIVSGVATINQSYSIAENIYIRALEKADNPVRNSGNSPIIQFIPRQVRYAFDLPADADVNVPFTVRIRTIDQDTGTEVKNLNRANDLDAFSAITGLPVTGVFVPSGSNAVNIVQGVATLSATYNKTEPIFLKMTDHTPANQPSAPTQAVFTSQGSVNVHPGALSAFGITDFTIQSNETHTVTVTALDTFGNPIPNQLIRFELLNPELPGQVLINGTANGLSQRTDSQGQITLLFQPSGSANGVYQFRVADGDRPAGYTSVLNATVLGLGSGPRRALDLGANRILLHTRVKIDLTNLVTSGGTIKTFYRVDGGAFQEYDPAQGAGGFDATKQSTLEWYSIVCYDPACTNPIDERTINGAPNIQLFDVVAPENKLTSYPNPFNPKGSADENFATLQYPLGQAASVKVRIYTLDGRLIWHKDIDSGARGGEARIDNQVYWFGINDEGQVVANGVYIARIEAPGQNMHTKIMVVK